MLIIAIPKSASTSLMVTLGGMHHIPTTQTFFEETAAPFEMKVLHRYHSDIREIGDEQVEGFRSNDQIFKQHLPPTERNLRLLGTVKKVILLREPREIIEAYYRAEKRKMHSPRPEFRDCQTLQDWHDTAGRIGLSGDLKWFYDGWVESATINPEMSLIVHYSDLIQGPTETVNTIEEFFGLPKSLSVVLSKERYSRDSQFRYLLRQIMRSARRFLQRMSG